MLCRVVFRCALFTRGIPIRAPGASENLSSRFTLFARKHYDTPLKKNISTTRTVSHELQSSRLVDYALWVRQSIKKSTKGVKLIKVLLWIKNNDWSSCCMVAQWIDVATQLRSCMLQYRDDACLDATIWPGPPRYYLSCVPSPGRRHDRCWNSYKQNGSSS